MVESVKIAIDGSLFPSSNCELIGTTWNRVDITKTAEVLMIDINGKLTRFRASAGDNPITSWDLLNGVVVSDTSGNLPSITQITTRNHNDLQNRDASGAHPASAITVQPPQTLTDGANISWDMNSGGFGIVTLGDNRTLSNPINVIAGAAYRLIIKQDAIGSRTLAFGSNYKFPGGVVPTLSSTANAIDILEFLAETTSVLHCTNFIADSK